MIASEQASYRYISAYPDIMLGLPGQDCKDVSTFRKDGLEAFSVLGFPHNRLEDWRYTSLNLLQKSIFLPSANQLADTAPLNDMLLADAWQIVLVNGRFLASLSALSELPPEVTVQSLGQVLQETPERAAPYLGKAVSVNEHGLIAFNNAWFSDGVFIEIPAGVCLTKPLQIVHFVSEPQALAATRQLLILHENAAADVIETYSGIDAGYLSVAVNECFLGAEASLTLCKVQAESVSATHFGGTYVKQSTGSRFRHDNFAFGALLARSDIHSEMQAAAKCELNGLYVGKSRQHIDNHTRINHLQPHGFSREFYKGVLAERARGVFQGRVVVGVDAQKTDSQMQNRNLLLSADAEADTKPQLEIYADDVKCSHGVTVGQLDDKSIFFLQARGIDAEAAKRMLTFAFANEMIDKVEHGALKELLLAQLTLHDLSLSE